MISLIWRRRLHCWIRLKFRPMRAVSLPYLIYYISIFEIKIYKYVNLDQMDKCYTSLTFLHWFWQYWPHKSYISSHHVSKYLSNIWLNKMKWIVLFFIKYKHFKRFLWLNDINFVYMWKIGKHAHFRNWRW